MKVNIVVGNMLNYPAECLLVGSNVRGHCEAPTSLVSQILDLLEPEELVLYENDNKTVRDYGEVNFYIAKNEVSFNAILIGYPGTGHQESFEKMLKNAFAHLLVHGFQTGRLMTLTMPLVGHSKTGLTLEEWVESFHKVLKKEFDEDPGFIGDINVVCKTEEQAEFIRKTISTSYQ